MRRFGRELPFSVRRSPRYRKDNAWATVPTRRRAAQGEGTYITLSETEEELRETAFSHNWSLDERIDILEFVPFDACWTGRSSKAGCIRPIRLTWSECALGFTGDETAPRYPGRDQIKSIAPRATALFRQAGLAQAFDISLKNRLVPIGRPVTPAAYRKLWVEPHHFFRLSASLVHHAEFGEAGG
jgi:hypothetical protein